MGTENNRVLFSRARSRALRLLAHRARSSGELEKRLLMAGFPGEITASVMEELRRNKYIDDEAFAREWISRRLTLKGLGRYRLEAELKERGVAKELIERCLAELDDVDELEKALELARNHKERRGRNSLQTAGFLRRRGFTGETIRKAVRGVYRGDEDVT
jgi:regulatory protein